MEEKIVNAITGMAEDGIFAPTNWVAVFTDKRAIFLKISYSPGIEFISPLANRISSSVAIKTFADSLKGVPVEQILNSKLEKVIFTPESVKDINILEYPASFFRSVISFISEGKRIKLKMYKDTIRSIKSSLYTLNPNISSLKTERLHSVNYERNISYGIQSVGFFLFMGSLWNLVNGVGVKDLLLLATGLLIFFKRTIGIYLLAVTIILDLIVMKVFSFSVEVETLMGDIIVIIILAGVLAFLWKFKGQLK